MREVSELVGSRGDTRKDRIGTVAEDGTTDSVYSNIRARSPSFEGVRYRDMLQRRRNSKDACRFQRHAIGLVQSWVLQ